MHRMRRLARTLSPIMALLIFGPLFLLDIDPIQQLEPESTSRPGPGGPVHPANPREKDNRPPANTRPAANQGDPTPRENGLVE